MPLWLQPVAGVAAGDRQSSRERQRKYAARTDKFVSCNALLGIYVGLHSNQFSAIRPTYGYATGKRYFCRDALPDFATRRLLTRLGKVAQLTE